MFNRHHLLLYFNFPIYFLKKENKKENKNTLYFIVSFLLGIRMAYGANFLEVYIKYELP